MVCIVTGSSRGLGRAVALAFGRRGHQVTVHYRKSREEAERVASDIREAMTFRADARNAEEVGSLVKAVLSKWGTIDVLVNNAGIVREALLLKTAERDFDDIIATNLKGPFHFIRAVMPVMMRRRRGHIINVASFSGLKGRVGLSAYSASKAGLIGLTVSAARELSRYDIMVNAVLPGYMLTDMGSASRDSGGEMALKDSLIKDFSDPERVAEWVCHITQTNGVTGQVFNLDSRIC